MSKIKEFIDSVISNDASSASTNFDALIRDKVRTTLEVKKVELTSTIYTPPVKTEG